MASGRAIRSAVDGHYDEILEFVDTGDGAIATCTNIPTGSEVLGGVVICSSLYNEFLKNYRREVMLARALAIRGIAVQRLHYRGTGHSDGVPTDTTLDTMQHDVRVAAARLAELAGTNHLAYVGTRFGGLVAAGAATDGVPLALLEPVVDADRFFREGLRTILFAGVVRKRTGPGGARPTTVDDLAAELTAAGQIDVLGYTIGLRLFEEAQGATLLDLIGAGSRPVMLVQLGTGELRHDLRVAVEEMVDLGCGVTTELAGTREAWWFAEEEEEVPGQLENRSLGLDVTDSVVESIGTWLVQHLGSEMGS